MTSTSRMLWLVCATVEFVDVDCVLNQICRMQRRVIKEEARQVQ